MSNKPVTVNDYIQADPRVVELKKKYTQHGNLKNQLVLTLSYVEADIISTMGAFEYLNSFTEVEEARKELLGKFMPLIQKKNVLIDAIALQDKVMQTASNEFEILAQKIVEELKAQAAKPQEVACETSNPCTCGDTCGCQTDEHQCCDHCTCSCSNVCKDKSGNVLELFPGENPEPTVNDVDVVPGAESSR